MSQPRGSHPAPHVPNDPFGHSYDHDVSGAVQRALAEFLTTRGAEAARLDPRVAALVASLTAFVLNGGKRIRPTFAWWGWRGAGGSPEAIEAPAVLKAVSALELIHACALIHDDLIDASTTRRGAPTKHVEFAATHRAAGWIGEPERFGAAVAILLGDLALAWADDMLREAGLWSDQMHRATPVWQAMRTELLAGQYLDVLTQSCGDESAEAALRIDRYKTAAYTVERPLLLGCALADADASVAEAYRGFGADLGIAFQLRDDLLGMFGDPEVTGKPAGDDLREGKRTLLLAYGLRNAEAQGRGADARLLRSVIGAADLDEAAVNAVRQLLIDLGAVAEVEGRIHRLTDSALAKLRAADVAEPAASRLAELAAEATARVR